MTKFLKYTSCSDMELASLIKRGDKDAFVYFYKSNFIQMCRFASHYVMSQEIGKDIVQDSFCYLLDNIQSINTKQSLKSFLYAIIKNKCLDLLRSYKVTDNNRDRLIESMVFSGYSEYDDDLWSKVIECSKNLPEQQRKVIFLRAEGKNYEEIACELGIATSTVNVHLKRAFKFFRDRIVILFFLFTSF